MTAAWVAVEVSVGALIRPLIVSLLLGLIVAVGTAGLFGSDRGAVLAVAAIGVVTLPSPEAAAVIGLAAAGLVVVASRLVSLGRIDSPWGIVSRALTAFTAALAVVVVAQAVRLDTFHHIGDDIRTGRESPHASGAPDVYVLLLDEHIRPDKLADDFGDDNGFGEALEQRRFAVASHSRSNYMATALTLLSMLDETQLTVFSDWAALDPADPSYNRSIYAALNNNRVFEQFQQHGYETVAIAPGWEVVTIRSADLFVDTGQMSEFERHLFVATDLHHILGVLMPDFSADQLRGRILANPAMLVHFATSAHNWPRFVFAHVPSPHYPNVFNGDGTARAGTPVDELDVEAVAAQREGIDKFRAEYAAQVDYVDQVALRTIDQIAKNRKRDYVLYVMSDHGERSRVADAASGVPDIDEGTANLLAVYASKPTPGLIDDTMTPVNLFRRYFRIEFGDDLPDLPNTIYAWKGRSQFNLVEVPNPDG